MRCRPTQLTSIDVLPDEVLLEIFVFYVRESPILEAWIPLVHVCQRWRSIVLGSPRYLYLRLHWVPKTKGKLDVWPDFPLVAGDGDLSDLGNVDSNCMNNVIALLPEHSKRVCEIGFVVPSKRISKTLAAMEVSFPELTDLWLSSTHRVPVAPDSFLGGSAPRLRSLHLGCIAFPELPKFLSSATHLVSLSLQTIPPSGYIAPEAMAACLSTLTSLKELSLGFEYSFLQALPLRNRHLAAAATYSVLPALTYFAFLGFSEYLEDLVALIDAPQLYKFNITFFEFTIDTPQLALFISRTTRSKAPDTAKVVFGGPWVILTSRTFQQARYNAEIVYGGRDRQLSSLAQVCSSLLPALPTLENLYIHDTCLLPLAWQDHSDNMLWLRLLHPFTHVKNLYLCKETASRIGPALQELNSSTGTE